MLEETYLESGPVRIELVPFHLYTNLPTYAGDTYLESGHVRFELDPLYLNTIYLPMLEKPFPTSVWYLESGQVRFESV
jgi:hypothetical protein